MKYLLFIALSAALAGCAKDDPEPPVAPSGSGGTPCTYTTGAWGPWANGFRERTVVASPTGCTGTPPAAIEEHPCVGLNRGWLRITNNSTNPYRVTITGPTAVAPFDLPGGFMADSVFVGVGTYGLQSLQLSGYVFTPSEFNSTRNITRCNVGQWAFP